MLEIGRFIFICGCTLFLRYQFQFVSLSPKFDIDIALQEMDNRIGWMQLENFQFDAQHSKEYLVQANWALYCDIFLDGFHIPYFHEWLDDVICF